VLPYAFVRTSDPKDSIKDQFVYLLTTECFITVAFLWFTVLFFKGEKKLHTGSGQLRSIADSEKAATLQPQVQFATRAQAEQ
jgi:hypothetical protein